MTDIDTEEPIKPSGKRRPRTDKEKIKALKRGYKEKRNNLKVLEKEYVELRKEAKKWKEKFEFVLQENEELSEESSKLEPALKQIEVLREEVTVKNEENEALRGLTKAMEASLKKKRDKRRESDALSAISERSLKQTDDNAALIESLREEIKMSTTRVEDLEVRIKQAEEEIEERIGQNEEMQISIAQNEEKQRALKQEVERLEKIETLYKDLQEEFQDSEEMMIKQGNEIERLESVVEDLKKEGERLATELVNRSTNSSNGSAGEWSRISGDNLRGNQPDGKAVNEICMRLPSSNNDGTKHLIRGVLSLDKNGLSDKSNAESIIKNLSSELEEGLEKVIYPMMKKNSQVKTALYKRKRKTVVVDMKLVVQKGPRAGSLREDSKIGSNHTFTCYQGDEHNRGVKHGPRYLHGTKAQYISKAEEEEIEPIPATGAKNRFAIKKKFGSMVAGAKKQLSAAAFGQKVHENSICDACGKSPIVGTRWSCNGCEGYELCNLCYGAGCHGLKNNPELFERVEHIVLSRCSRLKSEADLVEMLKHDICKNDLKKFSFCLNWIADIITGKTTKDLSARALEIPHIDSSIRAQIVPLLMLIFGERKDMEVKIEWRPEDESEPDNRKEILRMWIIDEFKKSSPFERPEISYSENSDSLLSTTSEEVESPRSEFV